MNVVKYTLIARLFAPFLWGNLLTPGAACAGLIVPVPSDISTTLTASPTTNLRPGQLIHFTMTVTNHGPVPVTRLIIKGQDIYDEFDPNGGSNDCGLITAVVDQQTTFYFYSSWYLTSPPAGSAMAVGETRTCHFVEALTSRAPAITPFSIGIDFYTDPDPSNDRSTVYLVRALDPIPTLSPWTLLGLAGLLAAIARGRLSRHKRGYFFISILAIKPQRRFLRRSGILG